MRINKDLLIQKGADPANIAFFEKYFPNGTEFSELATLRQVPYEFLHWIYFSIQLTPEEKLLYRQTVKIEDSESVSSSDHVAHSRFVSDSSNIDNSSFIFFSEDVIRSKEVVNGQTVEESVGVFNSNFVYNSSRIVYCTNINGSANCVNSRYVIGSRSVMGSTLVTDCHAVRRSNNITDCYFSTDCHQVKHALFCAGAHEQEYLLFNQPIEEIHFNNILAMYKKIVNIELNLIDDWVPEFIAPITPSVHYDVRKHYATLPAKFMKWLQSLPNYDARLMYQITYLSEFMK